MMGRHSSVLTVILGGCFTAFSIPASLLRGGSACGWPGAWAPQQKLFPTRGCARLHNVDLRDKVLPLTKAGTVFVSVFQEPLR